MCAGITTYAPLKRHLKPGGKVGVIGIGGLGHIALQFAAALPFGEVVAISLSPNKETEARRLGASQFLRADDVDAMAAASSSFDLILNTVSGHTALDHYIALLKPRGAFACVGLPSKSQKSQLWLQSVVPAERTVVGSYLGPYRDYDEMLDFAAKHGVKPQVELFPAADVNVAIAKLRRNEVRYRAVLVF